MNEHDAEVVKKIIMSRKPMVGLVALAIIKLRFPAFGLVALDASFRWHDVVLKWFS